MSGSVRARLDTPELLAEMAADLAAMNAARPNPLPDWRTYRGQTVRDSNGTLCVWRDVAGGYVPAVAA